MCGPIYSETIHSNVIVRSGPVPELTQAQNRLRDAQDDVSYYTRRLNETTSGQEHYAGKVREATMKLVAAQEHYAGIVKALDGGRV